MAKPLNAPTSMVAAQNPAKLSRWSAVMAVTPPAMPSRLPSAKPARRPMRPISSDAGMLVARVAIICSAIGAVARDLSSPSRS